MDARHAAARPLRRDEALEHRVEGSGFFQQISSPFLRGPIKKVIDYSVDCGLCCLKNLRGLGSVQGLRLRLWNVALGPSKIIFLI